MFLLSDQVTRSEVLEQSEMLEEKLPTLDSSAPGVTETGSSKAIITYGERKSGKTGIAHDADRDIDQVSSPDPAACEHEEVAGSRRDFNDTFAVHAVRRSGGDGRTAGRNCLHNTAVHDRSDRCIRARPDDALICRVGWRERGGKLLFSR